MKIRRRDRRRQGSSRALFEPLESRTLLSASALATALARALAALQKQKPKVKGPQAQHTFAFAGRVHPHDATPPGAAVTPAEMRGAYGIDQLNFNGLPLDGAGETIAIIDAYHLPTAYSDLGTFDAAFGLPGLQLYSSSGNSGAYFRQVAQDGSTNFPPTDPAGAGNANGTWELEESLDIQWAHTIAPAANIILVEANDPTYVNLIQNAENWARNVPGVAAISMSFGGGEFSSETTLDPYFTTPAGHQGITFVASTGDTGQPAGYPAYSPNVLAVGGTTLNVFNDTYAGEAAWNGSGGGPSVYEGQPAFQNGVVTQSSTKRTTPDVAMDADPNSGVPIYDSWDYGTNNGWIQIGGTSLAAPMWAGLIAVTDQLRSLNGMGTLDGPTQTLPKLYQLPSTDFRDVISGSNGFLSAPGYDLVTGRGTPIANLLVPHLAGLGSSAGKVFQDNNGDGAFNGTDVGLGGVTVYIDANNNGVRDLGSSSNVASTDIPKAIPDDDLAGVSSTLNITGFNTPISDLNIKFSITHTYDSDLTAFLISPDGTLVVLFSGVGGSGDNFTNTTLDDQAGSSIVNSSAPFSGTFRPSSGQLAVFNGHLANGTWTLHVIDAAAADVGTLQSWSLAITTGNELSTTTDGSGKYAFGSLAYNATDVFRQILPAHEIQDSPLNGAANVVQINSNVTGVNFGDFPTSFSGANFYARLDSTHSYLQIYNSASVLTNPTYQIALSVLTDTPGLTFNLAGAGGTFTADFSNGVPIPVHSLSVIGVAGEGDRFTLIGQGLSQNFTLNDTQIGPTAGGAILYQNISTLSLMNLTASNTGTLSTLDSLELHNANFNW